MQIMRRFTKYVALIAAGALLGMMGGAQIASASTSPAVNASYDGGTINLSQGWGAATVCAVTSTGAYCFDSQSDYEAWLSTQVNSDGVAPLTDCSSGLELFQDIDYGGDELILFQTVMWINLSNYSFSDKVSSYKVGACDISMTAGPNGSGAVYPGATSAGSDVANIGSAWKDRVQSVYIY